MDIQNNICDAIEMYLDNSLNSIPRDRTIQGQISAFIQPKTMKTVSQCTGYYKVKYQDSDLYCYTAYKDIVYGIGEYVYILIPEGNLNKNKIIVGRNYDLSEAYASQAEAAQEITTDDIDAAFKSVWGS